MKFDTVRLPAFLASALINGDTSGHTPEDDALLEKVHAWLAENHYQISDIKDESDFGTIYNPVRFTGDLATYTVYTS